MTKKLDFTRDSFIKFVKNLDEKTVDIQPEGFNNTIRWHVGHVLVVAEKFLFGYPEQSTKIPANYHDLFQPGTKPADRSEEHTSELQSRGHLVCRLLLEKKKQGRTDLPASRT